MKRPEQRPVRELKRMMDELPDPAPQPPQVITAAEDEQARTLELSRRRERAGLEFLQRKLAEYQAVKAEEKRT